MPKKNPNKKTPAQYDKNNPFMNEKWGRHPYMKWYKAVWLYNLTDDDPRFNIPRTGTTEHAEVRTLQHTKRFIKQMEEPAKTARPSLATKEQRKKIVRSRHT